METGTESGLNGLAKFNASRYHYFLRFFIVFLQLFHGKSVKWYFLNFSLRSCLFFVIIAQDLSEWLAISMAE